MPSARAMPNTNTLVGTSTAVTRTTVMVLDQGRPVNRDAGVAGAVAGGVRHRYGSPRAVEHPEEQPWPTMS